MDNLFLLKLNRAVWISYLEQKKVMEAANYFEIYRNALSVFKGSESEIAEAEKEIVYSLDVFLEKVAQLSKKFIDEKDYPQALICCSAYFKHDRKNTENLKYYTECLRQLKQYDLEIEFLHYIESVSKSNNEINKFIAEAYHNKEDYYKAVEYLDKYLNNKKSVSAEEYNLQGCYYNNLYSDSSKDIEDAKKSLKAFQKAITIKTTKTFLKNITIMASKCNEYEIGKKAWDEIKKSYTMTNDDKYDYAAFCLKHENFEEWHEYFEARFNKENNSTIFPKLTKPKWNGKKDLSNSTLLVYYEQGFGDSFLMYGYLPRLVKLAKHVIFVVQESIYPLLKDNEYGIEVLPSGTDISKIKYDYYIPSMSIPIVLKYDRSNLSVGEGYIKADKKLVADYKSKYFSNDKLKIGISLSGSSVGDKNRDITPNNLVLLDKLENVELYCITKDIEDKDFDCFKNNKVINIAKTFKDFSDTAAAMENMDVIISADNVLLNLAGALGKKTFGLFNWANQFRWFDLTGEDTVWYTSVKPFVNDKMNNWEYSVSNIVKELKKLISK